MSVGRRLLIGIEAGLALADGAEAASRNAPNQFPLGESLQSGAVCQAVRDDDDAAAKMRGARPWQVGCRGWDNALGRLYAYTYRGRPRIRKGALCQPATATTTAERSAAATIG
jgi:hypothetical protein